MAALIYKRPALREEAAKRLFTSSAREEVHFARGLLGSTREEVSGSEFLSGGGIREEVDAATF